MWSIPPCVRSLSLALVFCLFLPSVALAREDPDPIAPPNTIAPSVWLPIIGAPRPAPADEAGIAVDPALVSAAELYWSAERASAARPLDLLIAKPHEEERLAAGGFAADVAPTGYPDAVPGRGPLFSSAALAQALYPEAWRTPEQDAAADAEMEAFYAVDAPLEPSAAASMERTEGGITAYAYPPPFTRYAVNTYTQNWKSYPWSTVGKVFFTIPGRGNYMCSGAVAAGRAVWTAGHCLYTPGVGWHTNVTFVPAFRNGVRPYGTFSATYLQVLSPWKSSGHYGYDVGMFTVADRVGRKLGDWVGYLGAAWNQSPIQQFHTLGYPSNILSAQYLIGCATSTSRTEGGWTPNPVGVGCDMGGGSSGGPWLRRYAPYAAGWLNFVNGVTSFAYETRSSEPHAAYFGNAAASLYNAMRYK